MRTSALLAAAALVVITLTGCQTDDPPIVPQPEPSTTPLFASEEEALAAAEEAFGAYLAVLDSITSKGGASPDGLSEVASPSVVEHESLGLAEMSANDERTVGRRTFDSAEIQSVDLTSMESTVVLYVCQDFTDLDIVDSSGSSVVSPSRQLRYPLVVTFDVNEVDRMWVAGVDDWTGADFCVA